MKVRVPPCMGAPRPPAGEEHVLSGWMSGSADGLARAAERPREAGSARVAVRKTYLCADCWHASPEQRTCGNTPAGGSSLCARGQQVWTIGHSRDDLEKENISEALITARPPTTKISTSIRKSCSLVSAQTGSLHKWGFPHPSRKH